MPDETKPEFTISEARTHLSRIIQRVEQGEEIIITRAGRPIAKVVPLPLPTHRTGRGSLRGKLGVTDDWDARAVNDEIAQDFGLAP